MSFQDQVLDRLYRTKEAEARHRRSNPPPADKFMKIISDNYKSANGYAIRKWKNPNLWFTFDQNWNNEEFGRFGVLLRNVYTFRAYRKNGLFREFLSEILDISERTGCLIFGVCSPFELPDNEYSEHYNIALGKFLSIEYPEFEVKQKQMRDLLTGFGFSTVGNLRGIYDRTNIDLEDYVYYKPRKHNAKFVRKYLESDS